MRTDFPSFLGKTDYAFFGVLAPMPTGIVPVAELPLAKEP